MVSRSAWPDVSIPDVSLTEYVLRHAERLRDKPAMVDGVSGHTLTYGSSRTRSDGWPRRWRVADSARATSSRSTVRISPSMPSSSTPSRRWAASIRRSIRSYTAGELANQLRDSGARFLITVPMFLDKAKEAAATTGIEELYVFGSAEGARSFAELLDAPAQPPAVRIDPRTDVVALPYSSGTTGLPKGVMLTHGNLVANLAQCEGAKSFDGFKEADVVIAVLPFFHIYGMVVIMKLALSQGGTVVSMPRFDFREFLGAMQKHRVTIAPLVPPIVLGMVKNPAVGEFDLSRIRLVVLGRGAARRGHRAPAEQASSAVRWFRATA